MEAPADIPPIIHAPRRSFAPVVFFACVACAIAASIVSGYFEIGFPKCSFKTLTGIPCAFCGGTRSLRAIGHFDFAEAFWFNPLVTLGVVAAAICVLVWAIAPKIFDQWLVKVKKLPLLFIGLGLVALNWIFVLKFLPR